MVYKFSRQTIFICRSVFPSLPITSSLKPAAILFVSNHGLVLCLHLDAFFSLQSLATFRGGGAQSHADKIHHRFCFFVLFFSHTPISLRIAHISRRSNRFFSSIVHILPQETKQKIGNLLLKLLLRHSGIYLTSTTAQLSSISFQFLISSLFAIFLSPCCYVSFSHVTLNASLRTPPKKTACIKFYLREGFARLPNPRIIY